MTSLGADEQIQQLNMFTITHCLSLGFLVYLLILADDGAVCNLVKSSLIHSCYLIIKLRECYIGHQQN